MRFHLFPLALLTVCLLPETVPAQTAPVAPPHTLNSVTPSDGNYKAHYPWNKECEDRIAAMRGKTVRHHFHRRLHHAEFRRGTEARLATRG